MNGFVHQARSYHLLLDHIQKTWGVILRMYQPEIFVPPLVGKYLRLTTQIIFKFLASTRQLIPQAKSTRTHLDYPDLTRAL